MKPSEVKLLNLKGKPSEVKLLNLKGKPSEVKLKIVIVKNLVKPEPVQSLQSSQVFSRKEGWNKSLESDETRA